MANPENKQIPYESTQKDIRDAIESVATAIGGITHPDAEDIVYDNTTSGLSATDVQNAIDELSSEKADSSSLATVATSGDYDDLINKPTIPTVNDATLTIQKNGSDVATFTANASSNVTANVTVPTTTSELTNNSDFVSDASYVHTDNNFTTAEKTKLGGIENGAEVNVQSDWNEADNTADDYIKNKPSSEVKSATDTFTTVNGGLLSKCVIDLEPIQSGSGDPSPDNVRPISGHTECDLYNVGKNLIKISSSSYSSARSQNTTSTILDDGVEVTATGTYARRGDIFNVEIGQTYTLSFNGLSTGDYNRVYVGYNENDINDTYTTRELTSVKQGYSITFTAITSKLLIVCYVTTTSSSGTMTITNLQLEKGSTATPYEPYLGHLYQVQIGSTVYGGTVDLVSGVMTVTHVSIDLGSLIWTRITTNVFKADNSGMEVIADNVTADLTCEIYKKGNYTGLGNGEIAIRLGSQIWVRDSTVDDATIFINQVNGKKLVYPLATPQTIQLTPQQIEALVGQNNLSTPLDGQSIDSVKYREVFVFDDVEKVVSLRVPISMLGTDESGRTTASQAYASGDYFYKDGYMCKALTSISAGATLTLNTNYSQGTLADVLKAIENA